MASHRRTRTPVLPSVARLAKACAFAPVAMIAIGGGVAAADTGATGGQTAPCHEDVVCAPINAGINAPIDADVHDVAVLNHIHLLHH